MNETDLQGMLDRANALSADRQASPLLRAAVMERIKGDDGRTRRWRSFVLWLLVLGMASGLGTALVVGWSKAARDTAHLQPPRMHLLEGGLPE